MDATPGRPPSPDDEKNVAEALKRRQRQILEMSTVELSAAPSRGEWLLPFFFAAQETCIVDAVLILLTSLSIFGRASSIMPLWTPFVLIGGSHWFATYLERRELRTGEADEGNQRERARSGTRFVFLALAVVMLVSIWSSVYASSAFLLDPRWILSLLTDLLLLSPNAYHVLAILVLSAVGCWRGISLSRRLIEPGDVLKELRWGMGIIIAVIVMLAGAGGNGVGFNELLLLLLIPLFLYFGLSAHALSHAIFVRNTHPLGLQGSIAAQERSLLSVIGTLGGLLVLLALLLGAFVNPTVLIGTQHALAPVGLAYDWLVNVLAHALVFVLTPLFWLFSLIHVHARPPANPPPPTAPARLRNIRPGATPQAILTTIAVLKVVLPILFIALALLLIWWALRRRRITLLRRRDEDLHESVWSWDLFWTQLKALLLALWLHFFPRPAPASSIHADEVALGGEPTARSIREIYRALLKWAAGRGYPRKKDETPYEFEQRLQQQLPQTAPELGVVTDAYTAVRYGEVVPDASEVARVQQGWQALQQKERTQNSLSN